MDYVTVQAQLNDLPTTYTRPDAGYQAWLDAMTFALTLYTDASDDVATQINFSSAIDGWLDCWGLLWGIQRQYNEANKNYYARILETLKAWMCTLPGLQAWVNLFASGGSITENANGLGYVVTLPSSMLVSQIQSFIDSLGRIRPAGVPFIADQITDGLFLNTVNFVSEGQMSGSYLTSNASVIPIVLSAVTNNFQPLLPDLYFTDPIINTFSPRPVVELAVNVTPPTIPIL